MVRQRRKTSRKHATFQTLTAVEGGVSRDGATRAADLSMTHADDSTCEGGCAFETTASQWRVSHETHIKSTEDFNRRAAYSHHDAGARRQVRLACRR